MKIPSLEIKKLVEEIVDTPEGQETKYRLVMEGSGYKAVIVGGEPFQGFTAKSARPSLNTESTRCTLANRTGCAVWFRSHA